MTRFRLDREQTRKDSCQIKDGIVKSTCSSPGLPTRADSRIRRLITVDPFVGEPRLNFRTIYGELARGQAFWACVKSGLIRRACW